MVKLTKVEKMLLLQTHNRNLMIFCQEFDKAVQAAPNANEDVIDTLLKVAAKECKLHMEITKEFPTLFKKKSEEVTG